MRRLPPIACLLPILCLLLLPTLLLWRVVFAGDVFLPADLLHDIAPWHTPEAQRVPWNPLMWDSLAEFYPWRLFAAQTLKQGFLPLWNPHQFCGTPFVANAQSAVFYPPNLLFCLLPVARAFGVSAWLHLALTGLFLYGFLRSSAFSLSAPAALLGAVAWQMSAWQVSWLALPTFLCVSCWLPLALWLAHRACLPSAGRAAGRWTGLGVCLGMMVLAGHLQIALYCVGLTASYTLFLAWPRLCAEPESRLSLVAGGLVALVLLIGIAASQVLPSLELARVSHRSGAPLTGARYAGYVALAMPTVNLVTLFLPGFFGNPTQGTYWGAMNNGGPSGYMENACYVGILALVLAAFGCGATWRRCRGTRFFSVAALVALLMALGTPLDAVLYFGLPGFAQSGSPGRILVIWTLGASVLAAVGAEALMTGRARSLRSWKWAIGATAGAFLLSLAGTVSVVERQWPPHALAIDLPRVGDLWRVPVGILLGAASLFWLRRRGTLSHPTAGFLLAGLAATDLLAAGWGYNRTARADRVYPVTPAIAFLQQHTDGGRILVLNHGWSVDPGRPPNTLLPPNTATVFGLDDVAGYDSLLTRRSFEFIQTLNGGRSPAPRENGNLVFTSDYTTSQAQAAAARYVLSPFPLFDARLTLATQDPEIFVYRNLAALPRVRQDDSRQTALWQDLAPTRLGLEIADQRGGSVVVADQWYPGWQARGGYHPWDKARPAAITPEQGMFRRVAVETSDAGPEKDAHMEMRYLPTTVRVGLYGLCLAFAAVLSVLAASVARLGRRGGR